MMPSASPQEVLDRVSGNMGDVLEKPKEALDRVSGNMEDVLEKPKEALDRASGNMQDVLEKSAGTVSSSVSNATAAISFSSRSQASIVSNFQVELSDLPPELAFLASPECNPDFRNPEAKKQGYVRRDWDRFKKSRTSSSLLRVGGARRKAQESLEAAQNVASQSQDPRDNNEAALHGGMFYGIRRCFGRVVLSWPVQTAVMLTILFDCAITVIDMIQGDDDDSLKEVTLVSDVLVITVFSIDILARIMFSGCSLYWRRKMNCFEFLILVVSIVDVVISTGNSPTSAFRIIRPVMRLFRVVRLFVRIFQRGRFWFVMMRHAVSGNRKRTIEEKEGFDLDLAYTTSYAIAMSTPATGYAAIFHNPLEEVARFMNERHPNRYIILNTMEEQKYSTLPFFHRCLHFPIPQNGVPTIEGLLDLCRILTQFLDAAPGEHVIAVHSMHGQGRVGLVIAALLLYRGEFEAVPAAIAFLEQERTKKDCKDGHDSSTQCIDTISQERFLEYFAVRCRLPEGEQAPEPRRVMLRKIKLYGCPDATSLDVSCFAHPGVKVAEAVYPTSDHSPSKQSIEVNPSPTTPGDPDRHISYLSLPTRKVKEKLMQLQEECRFDSPQAGTHPIKDRPALFSSRMGADNELDTAAMEFRPIGKDDPGASEEHLAKNGQVAVWEFVDTKLAGEIRFEVHRASKDGVSGVVRSGVDYVAKRSRVKNFTDYLFRRQSKEPQGKNAFSSGMLFCCWLHTSFLEMDEQKSRSLATSNAHDDSLVHVVLQRFDLDKAVYAPRLTSYTNALKLHIEFQADRKESLMIRHDGDSLGGRQLWDSAIITHADVSPPCTLSWLNFLIRHLWPICHGALAKALQESIEPNIRDLLPAPLNNLTFKAFSFTSANYPELGPITASSRHQEGFELQLDIWVNYDAAVDVQVNAVGLGLIGMNHLKLSGLLSVKLKPINNELPVIEGVQFVFLNMPEMDLNFTGGLAGGAANVSMIKKAIMDAVQTSLLDIVVMPNVVVLNYSAPVLEAGDMICTFQDVLPHAVMRLKVVEARDLGPPTGMRAEILCSGSRKTPDPYAILSMAEQKAVTASAEATVNPMWLEEFDFLLYDEGQHLKIQVKDGGFNSFTIGEVKDTVSAGQIIKAGQEGNEGAWFSLVGANGEPKGKICLTATILDLQADLHELRQGISSAQAATAVTKSGSPRRPSIFSRKQSTSNEEPETSTDGAATLSIEENVSRHDTEVSGAVPPSVLGNIERSLEFADSIGSTCYDGAVAFGEAVGSTAWMSLAGLTSTIAGTRTRRGAQAVGVLICSVKGGHLPSCAPHLVDVRVRLGHACSPPRRCMEATHAEMPNVNKDLETVIRRLAMKVGYDKTNISDVVEKPEDLVLKVMRKQLEWNLDLPHRLCVPFTIPDCVLEEVHRKHGSPMFGGLDPVTGMVEVAVLHKNKVLGVCYVELHKVFDTVKATFREEKELTNKDGHKVATLDVELSLYSLKQRATPATEQASARRRQAAEQELIKKSALKKERRKEEKPKDAVLRDTGIGLESKPVAESPEKSVNFEVAPRRLEDVHFQDLMRTKVEGSSVTHL